MKVIVASSTPKQAAVCRNDVANGAPVGLFDKRRSGRSSNYFAGVSCAILSAISPTLTAYAFEQLYSMMA